MTGSTRWETTTPAIAITSMVVNFWHRNAPCTVEEQERIIIAACFQTGHLVDGAVDYCRRRSRVRAPMCRHVS